MNLSKRIAVFMLVHACSSPAAPAPDAAFDAHPADAPSCDPSTPPPCPPKTHATWPMPNSAALPLPNPAAMRANGEVAVDLVTGLTWQRSFTGKLAWDEAHRHCAGLVYMGTSDWRVPSRIELVSLVDHTRAPSLDGQAFPATPADYFWTSSLVPFAPEHAYSVYFGAGFTAYGKKDAPSAHVRCVRGGVAGASPRFLVNQDEAIDLNTGLHWQRILSSRARRAWDEADAYCASLSLAGSQTWRLPSPKELQTLVDETAVAPLIDALIFPNTPAARFWTAPALARTTVVAALYVDFDEGISEEAQADETMHVRCVR